MIGCLLHLILVIVSLWQGPKTSQRLPPRWTPDLKQLELRVSPLTKGLWDNTLLLYIRVAFQKKENLKTAKVLLFVCLFHGLVSNHTLKLKGDAGHSVSTVALWQAVHKTLCCDHRENEGPGPWASTLQTWVPEGYNQALSSPERDVLEWGSFQELGLIFSIRLFLTTLLQTDFLLGFCLGPHVLQSAPTPAQKT